MIESERGISHEFEERPGKEVFLGAHAYQPPREILLPTSGTRIHVWSDVNERIYQAVYKPLLVEDPNVTQFAFSSFYAPLRDWMQEHHPEGFEKIKEKVQKKPDQILGDPYLHVILPLLPEDDQNTLVRLGKRAIKEDLGVTPRVFWLPETAVSNTTLNILAKNGYEAVVLREQQIKSTGKNPMFVKTTDGEIAIIHTDIGLGDSISFKGWFTENGDRFYDSLKESDKKVLPFATDMETYGGYENPNKSAFARYISKPEVLNQHNFSSFNLDRALSDPNREYTEIEDRSSWSCPDRLGRWTGSPDCNCDNPSEERKNEKRWLIATLGNYGNDLNKMLSERDPNWHRDFEDFFLEIRKPMFRSGSLKGNEDRLFLAKICQLIGMTSCAWFFAPVGGTETIISHSMNTEIPKLIEESRMNLSKAA